MDVDEKSLLSFSKNFDIRESLLHGSWKARERRLPRQGEKLWAFARNRQASSFPFFSFPRSCQLWWDAMQWCTVCHGYCSLALSNPGDCRLPKCHPRLFIRPSLSSPCTFTYIHALSSSSFWPLAVLEYTGDLRLNLLFNVVMHTWMFFQLWALLGLQPFRKQNILKHTLHTVY